METKTDILLLEIQGFARWAYLSDLHAANDFDERAKVLIYQIPDDLYTVDEWNQAASYVTGKPCCYQSVREAKDKINNKGYARGRHYAVPLRFGGRRRLCSNKL